MREQIMTSLVKSRRGSALIPLNSKPGSGKILKFTERCGQKISIFLHQTIDIVSEWSGFVSGGDVQDLLSVGQDVIILQSAAIANEGKTACVVLSIQLLAC